LYFCWLRNFIFFVASSVLWTFWRIWLVLLVFLIILVLLFGLLPVCRVLVVIVSRESRKGRWFGKLVPLASSQTGIQPSCLKSVIYRLLLSLKLDLGDGEVEGDVVCLNVLSQSLETKLTLE
jgi:hypothetical protein